jgi:hypothetical protein
MTSYHVFFFPKSEDDELPPIASTHALTAEPIAAGEIRARRFLRVANAAGFAELPRFPLIVDCTDQPALGAAMAHIRSRIHEGPHGEILRQVGDFKASFCRRRVEP